VRFGCGTIDVRARSQRRAIQISQFGPIEAATLVEREEPVPQPTEVIVQVHAAPVNFVDLLVVSGAYQFLPILPFTPGDIALDRPNAHPATI